MPQATLAAEARIGLSTVADFELQRREVSVEAIEKVQDTRGDWHSVHQWQAARSEDGRMTLEEQAARLRAIIKDAQAKNQLPEDYMPTIRRELGLSRQEAISLLQASAPLPTWRRNQRSEQSLQSRKDARA